MNKNLIIIILRLIVLQIELLGNNHFKIFIKIHKQIYYFNLLKFLKFLFKRNNKKKLNFFKIMNR